MSSAQRVNEVFDLVIHSSQVCDNHLMYHSLGRGSNESYVVFSHCIGRRRGG